MPHVLLVNPTLPHSFWSFPENLAMIGNKALLPPLGLMTVAALLPEDWSVRLADMNVRPLSEEDWRWADVVFVTGMLVQREGLLEIVRQARNRQKLVAAGGAYPTTSPDEVMEAGCNYLFIGEGERTVALMVEDYRRGITEGTYVCDEKPDLSESPVPKFHLAGIDDYQCMSIQTSRGCPFRCEFCDIVSLFGRAQRYKTPSQVVRELEAIYQAGFKGTVFVADDNLIGNRAKAVEIIQAITQWQAPRGEPFSFITQASINLGQDKELIDLLTAANFSFVFVGIESPDEEVLQAAQKHQNIRNPLLESLRAINANGLSVIGSFILGLDEEKKGAGQRMQAFAEAADLPLVMVNVLRALPHTALWERLKKEGRLHECIEESGWDSQMNFVPRRPQREIYQEQVGALEKLHERKAYLGRAFRASLAMRPTRSHTKGATKNTVIHPSLKVKKRNKPRDISTFLNICWRQGVVAETRWQFWRQLFGVYKENPSRLRRYLILCAMGEDMFRFVDLVREQTGTRSKKNSSPLFQAQLPSPQAGVSDAPLH